MSKLVHASGISGTVTASSCIGFLYYLICSISVGMQGQWETMRWDSWMCQLFKTMATYSYGSQVYISLTHAPTLHSLFPWCSKKSLLWEHTVKRSVLIIGEREQANLVVQMPRFFDIVYTTSVRRAMRVHLDYALLFIRNDFYTLPVACAINPDRELSSIRRHSLHSSVPHRGCNFLPIFVVPTWNL